MACPGHEGHKQDVPAYLGVVVTVGGPGLLARAAKAPITAEDPRFSPPLLSQTALPQSLGKFRPCTKGWAAAPQRLFPPTCHVGLGRGVCLLLACSGAPPPAYARTPCSTQAPRRSPDRRSLLARMLSSIVEQTDHVISRLVTPQAA